MVSRVLVALAALIALAHADSMFDLRFEGVEYEMITATGVLDCFSNTNMTVQAGYGFEYDIDANADQSKPGYAAASCAGGTNGQVDMYADMVWAISRNGGDDQCLRFKGAATLDNQKPDATKTTFNQNFKYAITRKLQVCAYDSNWQPWNPVSTTVGRDKQNKQNDNAKPKVSYQADTWKIYSSKWNKALETNGDWSQLSTWCAGNCANTWTSPSNQLKGNEAYDTSFASPQEAFVGGSGAGDNNPACVGTSEWRCPAGQQTVANGGDACGFETTTATNLDYKKALSGSTAVEQIGCGSSPQLLARSANFGGITSAAFTKVAGSSMATKIGSQAYVYTFKASDLDPTVGIHEDIVGTNGLWSQITQFTPTITHFQGKSVSSPEFSSKTFWLNNANTLKIKFANANTQYQQIGSSVNANNANTNQIYLNTDLAVAGNNVAPPLQQVAFNRETQEATYLANKGRFSTTGQGSGNFGSVGSHYWARVYSSYTVQIKWTCNNLGGTDPNSGNGYPYRFNCDSTIGTFVATPGQAWNKPKNTFPTLKRQFTTTLYKNWDTKTFQATSDPVFLGMFASATNAGFSVASSVPAINGDAAKGVSTSDERLEKQAVAQEDQASGVALIGAGVVVLAVFGSLAICLGAAILGKLQAK